MQKRFFIALFVFLAIGLTTVSFGQKYGHLNSGNLLASLPEAKTAEDKLQDYRKQLSTAFETKVKDLETRIQAFNKQANSGTLSELQLEEKQKTLEKESNALAKEEQEIAMKIQKKREELLQPILKRVNDAITAVGEEKGYDMIFDTSIFNTVLFAKQGDDVMELVKAKL